MISRGGGSLTREQKYREQLRDMGVWQEAFAPEVHMLAMMEREHQRLLKTWKAAGSPPDETYQVIERQRRDILSHRDALGLTPKGLHRLRPKGLESGSGQGQISVLDQIRARRAEKA